jgi:predicted DCC family thiol-disulfide oxidoreductase YuxK
MIFLMTPYRFALSRILFGFYLFGFYLNQYLKTDPVIEPSIFLGLTAFSLLLVLGYKRQLVARSLLFFSLLLFIFQQAELHLDSTLIMTVLVLFALISGDEPWQIKDSTKISKTPLIFNRVYFWLSFLVIIILISISFLFSKKMNSGVARFYDWELYSLILLILILFFPKFLFRPKVKESSPILFFDGLCGLCSHFVDFVFAEDTAGVFKVAAIQGQTAQKKLSKDLRTDLTTVIVLDSEQLYLRSEAVLNLLYDIGGFWRLFFIFRVLPRPLCDLFYILVARFRYLIFGKKESCRLPTATEKSRFLN